MKSPASAAERLLSLVRQRRLLRPMEVLVRGRLARCAPGFHLVGDRRWK